MDTHTILINLIGFVACSLTIFSFQRKEPRQIFFTQIFSSLLWSIHFFFLGATAGALINLTNMTRKTALVYINDKYTKIFAALLLCFVWTLFFTFVYSKTTDLLPLAANTIGISFFFVRKNRYITARISIIGALLWLSYGFIEQSYPSIITEIFIISSIIIGMVRHEEKPFTLLRTKPENKK